MIFKQKIADYFLYRHRFLFAYLMIGLIFAGLILYTFNFAPNGLSQTEIKSASISMDIQNGLDVITLANTDLPYHLLQKTSISILGLNTLAIKLPSILIASLCLIFLALMYSQWFKRNVTILGLLITITLGIFLYFAQSGSPEIMYFFWPTLILFISGLIIQNPKYKIPKSIFLAISIALSLYTPMMIYVIISIVIAALLHPKIRLKLKRLPRKYLFILPMILVIGIAPLITSIVKNHHLLLDILAIPTNNINLVENIKILGSQFVDSINSFGVFYPAIDTGLIALVTVGLVQLFKNNWTVRTYLILSWTLLTLPILIINPSYFGVLFIPIILTAMIGLSWLLNYWYEIFPTNPYARVVGLFPITILLSALLFSSFIRYTNDYVYNPDTLKNFNDDLNIVNEYFKKSSGNIKLVVTEDQYNFYKNFNKKAINKNNLTVNVATSISSLDNTIVSREALNNIFKNNQLTPNKILVDSKKENSDRFYVYKTSSN